MSSRVPGAVVAEHPLQHELLSLDVLATEFGIHPRTLGDAVRTGRLAVLLSTRSAFGRPIRRATRAAVLAYQAQSAAGRILGRCANPPPVPVVVPDDCAERVTITRHALRLTLAEFASRVGAANKAVVYQWESGKPRTTLVFCARILGLRNSAQ